MTLDLDQYRINVSAIKRYCDGLSQKEREESVGKLANMTYCHIVLISYYLAELYGMTGTLQAKIDRDKQFYHVLEVFNYNSLSSIT